MKPATQHAAATAVTTTHAAAPAPHNPFVTLLAAAPAPDANPFVALLAAARAEADARPSGPSDRARLEANGLQFTGETRVDPQGRRQWLVVCGKCGFPSCEYSRWVTD